MMKSFRAVPLVAFGLAMTSAVFALNGASAQMANCFAAAAGPVRNSCLARQAEILRQEWQAYNDIADEQELTHDLVGEGLSIYSGSRGWTIDGLAAGVAGMAWEAPRIIYELNTPAPVGTAAPVGSSHP